MARKSSRVNNRKWPCGNCSFQCNANSFPCEDCGRWHHSKCEELSMNNVRTLHRLTEGYLCSSCTHNRGSYDFPAALLRLRNASRQGSLKTAVIMEQIFLRGTLPVEVGVTEKVFKSCAIDAVANEILKHAGKLSHIFHYIYRVSQKKYRCLI